MAPSACSDAYAALVNEWSDQHYGGNRATVAVYDLRTGNTVATGGESAGCGDSSPGCVGDVDQLVLGPDGATAAHTYTISPPCRPSGCTTVEQIVANDSRGGHTLDSITTTGPYNATPSSLSQLELSGHTLTWSHDGSTRTAQLN